MPSCAARGWDVSTGSSHGNRHPLRTRPRPGELLHLDTKQLGRIRPGGGHRIHSRQPGDPHRGLGWNRANVAVDDSRISYLEELADETPATTVGFLRRALAFYASHGITVERLLTDNRNPYRSRHFRDACAELAISPRGTRP